MRSPFRSLIRFFNIFIFVLGWNSRSLAVTSGHFTWPSYDVITGTTSTLTRCPTRSKRRTSIRDKSSFVSHVHHDYDNHVAFESTRDNDIAFVSSRGNKSHSEDVHSALGEAGKGFTGFVARFFSLVLVAHP